MVPGVHLTREDETFEDLKRYKRLVEKMNYLTRSDIAHLVSVVSQYMSPLQWSTIGQLLNRFYVT